MDGKRMRGGESGEVGKSVKNAFLLDSMGTNKKTNGQNKK